MSPILSPICSSIIFAIDSRGAVRLKKMSRVVLEAPDEALDALRLALEAAAGGVTLILDDAKAREAAPSPS